MLKIEKTVFISYRRTNKELAVHVFHDLTRHGYDVFIDYTELGSGAYEPALLGQIDARAHFVVILTPSALERCARPGDWFRREIERAIEMKRNIVPLMMDGSTSRPPP